MNNFVFYSPTEFVFGKATECKSVHWRGSMVRGK